MKFKFYYKNYSLIIDARDLKEAKSEADSGWKDIKVIYYDKPRKSKTLNKRSYVKDSDKKYDRKKDKRKIKKEIEEEL